MDLTIYEVILGPVITDKAYRLNKNLKKLVLRVHPQANKPMVKEALERLFDVKVDSVRMMIRKAKTRRVGRREIHGSLQKKAIISLAEGYSLDLLDQAGTTIGMGDHGKKLEKGKETTES